MKAMILAAGEGTRLRPYTLQLPKPAIPFLGVPLAFYGVELLREVGVNELVVNHYHLSKEILKLFSETTDLRMRIHFSDESNGLLGSGGGIHKAKPFLESEATFFVINGDEIILPNHDGQLSKALKHHQQSQNLMTICVKEHPDVGTKFGGVWSNPQNAVVQFSKTKLEGLKGWHYTGIVIFSNRIFSYFKDQVVDENILYDTATLAISKGEKVEVFPLDCQWFETGNPADFVAATDECLQALEQQLLRGWPSWLFNFLKSQKQRPGLVEMAQPLLLKKVDQLWKNLKS
ncbi:MAG: NDP-sugar synthase [Bdellovibrio sp.]